MACAGAAVVNVAAFQQCKQFGIASSTPVGAEFFPSVRLVLILDYDLVERCFWWNQAAYFLDVLFFSYGGLCIFFGVIKFVFVDLMGVRFYLLQLVCPLL